MYEPANAASLVPAPGVITRAMLERSARQVGSDYVFEGACPSADEAVLAGRFNNLRLRPGLILHTAEVRDLHDLSTHCTLGSAGIRVGLLVDGATDVAFGPRRVPLGAGAETAGRSAGVLLNLCEPTRFSRHWQRGRAERKVTLTLAPEWLEQGGLDGHGAGAELQRFARTHLDCRAWTPSPRARELARQILAPDAYLPGLHRLRLECRCLELASEALAALFAPAPGGQWLNAAERRHLVRLDELLHSDAAVAMSMADIACAVGSNPTTLQALARRAWNTTVFERLRALHMAKAHALLAGGASVAEAADAAGYASATNFATAFRQRYGVSPSRVRSAG